MGSEPAADPLAVSRAVVVWTGWDVSAWPARDERRVVEQLGREAALALLPVVKRLEREFFESDAYRTAAGLAEAGRVAAARFRGLHPEITDDAVDALAWCYMYDHK